MSAVLLLDTPNDSTNTDHCPSIANDPPLLLDFHPAARRRRKEGQGLGYQGKPEVDRCIFIPTAAPSTCCTACLLNNVRSRCGGLRLQMNKQSNRAHRIFIIKARFKEYDVEDSATLTFVDLAGSEDIGRSGATGITAKEAGHINKSLLSLGRVIDALAANEKHIPYRDSKLTQLLSEALGGSCKTTFITCVSPAISSHRETEKTVKYAVRAMEAMNISQLPRWKQDQIVIDGLTRRVEALINQLDKQSKAHKNETKALKEVGTHCVWSHPRLLAVRVWH